MALVDTAKVEIYRMDDATPNPPADTLLATDTTIVGGSWSVNTTGWSEGRYTIYALAYDLAGNQSAEDDKDIIVLPDPVRVAGLTEWKIGEIGAVTIGLCG